MKVVKTILLSILILYILALSYLYIFQRDLLFVRDHSVKRNQGFYLNKTTWIETREHNSSNALLYFGGNSEDNWIDINRLKEDFKNRDIFFMHYRGYNSSKGEPSESAIFSDALKLFDKVSKRYKNILVVGRSLGTGVAIYLASKREVNQLLLITPYDSIANIAKLRYPIFPIDLIMKDRFDSFIYAKDINLKPIIILSEKDTIVPHSSTKKLIKEFKYKPTIITIKDTNHTNIIYSKELFKGIE